MRTPTISALVATLLLCSTSAAQQLVGNGPIRSVPAPVLLDSAGLFQAVYASVGDDLLIGGQPSERALRDMKRAALPPSSTCACRRRWNASASTRRS